MKRRFSLLTVLLCLGLIISTTACDVIGEVVDEIVEEDKWATKTFEYTDKDGNVTAQLECYFLFNTGKYNSNGNYEFAEGVEVTKGWNIVIVGNTANESIQGLTSNTYMFKHFDGEQKLKDEGDSDSDGITINFSDELWKAFYIANRKEFNENGTTLIPPKQILKKNEKMYTLISDPKDFSWKKFLANYLIDKLLE